MNSKVKFEVKEGQLIVAVDTDADGKPVVTVALDLAQVLAEIAAAFKK